MTYARISGLGDLQYQTGRGIFRPGGNGGGIFDGNIAGLGAVAKRRRARRALARAAAMNGLGVVPAACWNVDGFKACHDTQFAAAQSFCGGQSAAWLQSNSFANVDACIKEYDARYTEGTCVPQYCGGEYEGGSAGAGAGAAAAKLIASQATPSTTIDTGATYPWNTYSAKTVALQQQTNKELQAKGYCPIGTDGKLGKGTCGAIKALVGYAPSTCQGFTDPKKPPCPSAAVSYQAPSGGGGGGGVTQQLTPEQQAALLKSSSSTDWTKYALFAGGAALVLGVAYYMEKRSSSNK